MLAGIISGVQTLLARLTSTRAGYLDKLNVAGSKVADGGYYTDARGAKLDYLDAAVSGRASAADYTTTRAAKLDNLDATVSSRMVDRGQTLRSARGTYGGADAVILNLSGVAGHLKTFLWQSYQQDGALYNLKVQIDGQAEYTIGDSTFSYAAVYNGTNYYSVIPLDVRFKSSCVVKISTNGYSVAYNLLYGIDI